MNKKGFEFSFGWLFAIIIGAMIIALAIYGANSFIKSSRNIQDSFTGKEIGILLNPIETSLEDSKTSVITFGVQTRIFNDCLSAGSFGAQKISTATKSGIGAEWQNPGAKSTFYNKYLFSSATVEGKKTYLLIKPFEFPYKVADIVLMWSDNEKYCFVGTPKDIEEDINDLGMNISISSSISNCSKQSKKVCFNTPGACEIIVDTSAKSVKKNSQTLYYDSDENNALLYGAIFSDPGIYECQVKRLMKRTAELAFIYISKSQTLAPRGCSTNMESDLSIYANQTLSFNNSISLKGLELSKNQLEDTNNALSCKLF